MREQVLKEFGADELVRLLPPVVAEYVQRMADEIVRLRSAPSVATPDARRDAVVEAAREWVRVRRDPSSYSIAVSVAQNLELAVRALAATTPDAQGGR